MRSYFFDSSALVKKYLIEEETDDVVQIFSEARFLFISHLTELEVTVTLEQAKRMKRINSPEYRQSVQAWEEDLTKTNLTKIDLDEEVVHLSKSYIKRHYLRAPDSIQLASAVLTSKKLGDDIAFVCADQTLLDAARLERLPCIHLGK